MSEWCQYPASVIPCQLSRQVSRSTNNDPRSSILNLLWKDNVSTLGSISFDMHDVLIRRAVLVYYFYVNLTYLLCLHFDMVVTGSRSWRVFYTCAHDLIGTFHVDRVSYIRGL